MSHREPKKEAKQKSKQKKAPTVVNNEEVQKSAYKKDIKGISD